ncbi:hypothetical protein HYX19_04915, partial [Candidatus Woesearchaeota archaeon]|nr:hypothetical protein [Candidatus Woesearchaeota archaeon]
MFNKTLLASLFGLSLLCDNFDVSLLNKAFASEKLEEKITKWEEKNLILNVDNDIFELPRKDGGDFYVNGKVEGKVKHDYFTEISQENFELNNHYKDIATISVNGAGNVFVHKRNSDPNSVYFSRPFYIGRVIDGIFRANPREATQFVSFGGYGLGSEYVMSYPFGGGSIYLNTEKTNYTIDLLGNIYYTRSLLKYFIGWFAETSYRSDTIQSREGVSSLTGILESSAYIPHPDKEPEFAFFKGTNSELNNLPKIFTFQNNFGDGQIFKVEKLANDGQPILKLTPFRVSADGIISDT